MNEYSCVICHERVIESMPPLECGHHTHMHRACLERWLQHRNGDMRGIVSGPCPVCRAPLMAMTDEYDLDFCRRPTYYQIAKTTLVRFFVRRRNPH